jgi:hypothetical protein
MDKPRWFLDVDGPINATNPGTKVWGGDKNWRESEVMGFVLRYNPELIHHIRVVSKLVDVAWCSTWTPYAELLEEAFSLPELPRAFGEPVDHSVWVAKVKAVEDFNQNTDHRWVWTDDEAPTSGPVYDSLMEGGRGLILRSDHYTGITPFDVQRIKYHFKFTAKQLKDAGEWLRETPSPEYTVEHDS